MKKIFIILIAALAVASFTTSKSGDVFPDLNGVLLTGDTVYVPKDTKGKYTLMGMAYSKKAEEELMTWSQPIYETFIHKAEGQLFVNDYDINLYFVPMFTGANTAVAGAARKKMLEHIDERLHEYVLFYKGSIKPYKTSLDMTEKEHPYFFLLDENGEVVHSTFGSYTDEKMIAIEEFLGGF